MEEILNSSRDWNSVYLCIDSDSKGQQPFTAKTWGTKNSELFRLSHWNAETMTDAALALAVMAIRFQVWQKPFDLVQLQNR